MHPFTNFKARTRAQQGFTLLELVYAILIIGILAAIAIAVYGQVQDKARHNAVAHLAQMGESMGTAALQDGDSSTTPESAQSRLNIQSEKMRVDIAPHDNDPTRVCATASWLGPEEVTPATRGEGCNGEGGGGGPVLDGTITYGTPTCRPTTEMDGIIIARCDVPIQVTGNVLSPSIRASFAGHVAQPWPDATAGVNGASHNHSGGIWDSSESENVLTSEDTSLRVSTNVVFDSEAASQGFNRTPRITTSATGINLVHG